MSARPPIVLALLAAASPLAAQDSVPARADYVPAAAMLTRVIVHEMADKGLPALSIVLVDDTAIVWARGFGLARPRDSVPATARTAYRVGTLSELLAGTAPARLAERRAAEAPAAAAEIWTPEGRRVAAPGDGVRASVTELGRALTALFAEPSVDPGFAALSRLRSGEPGRIGRDEPGDGCSATLAARPADRLAVVVVTSLDAASAVTGRVADAALRAMLATRSGSTLPELPLTGPLPAGVARSAAGHYTHGALRVDLLDRSGELLLARDGSALATRLRVLGDSLVFDDYLRFGGTVRLLAGAVIVDGDTFTRIAEPMPAPPPAAWLGLLGEYGPGDLPLFVYERGGRLHALVAWTEDAVMRRVSDTVFAFPPDGPHRGERLVFRGARAAGGQARAAALGTTTLPRRLLGPQNGGQLKVTPLHPVAELLAAARRATPPAESGSFRAPDLVDLATLDPSIRFDIRYATTNNFLGSVFYSSAHAFLQRPAAEALRRALRRLRPFGYGLLIHDGYRPWYVTRTFWDATPPALRWLVADPAQGSRHNRGCAVDLTLYDLRTGRPIDMGGTYDETTPRSYPDYPVTTDRERWHRELLRRVMEDEGFTRISNEWWHFDYRDWRSYPILNVPFEDL